MTLEERIQTEITSAMKNKHEVRLGALRSIKAAILNEKTSGKYHELTDEDVITIIQKLVKQRDEAAAIYRQASTPRIDLAEKEEAEKAVLEEFVPAQLTVEEVEVEVKVIIAETGATSMRDMGKVMGTATKKLKGKTDGKIISEIVKRLLS